jgi:peptide/nickel transport system ATP-binding protein
MRQRAMIAMALMCNPRLLIADEPTTALDVTVQAQILELLKELQQQFQMAILMITHNLGVIAELAHRVAVMYMGKVVETSESAAVFDEPQHPYTVGLLRSMPRLGKDVKARLAAIPGSVPDPFNIPPGCSFYPRCSAPKKPTCQGPESVPLTEVRANHLVRCTLYQ